MKTISKVFAILLLFISAQAFTQNLSNKGKEFWVGYGHHQYMETGGTFDMVLYFSAEQPANVTVTINGTSYVRNYSVPANSVTVSEIIPKSAALSSPPCSFAPPGYACGGVGVFNQGINIKSDVPIVAYAHIYGSASSGASMLMPVETWGYSYFSVNSEQHFPGGATNCFSWVYAIAKEDNTVIEVTPSVQTRNKMPAGGTYKVTLMKGQIYQTMAGPETGDTKPHMTGTKIKSVANANGDCYPIAVFSGSSRTHNRAPCGSGGGDNDNQQLFPTQAWGKRYLTAPTSSSANPSNMMKNTFKIIVKDPNTKVYLNGSTTPLTGLLVNSYYYFESNAANYIEADKPIMVAQFMTGGSSCLNGGVGDPEMIIISPLEQGIKRVGFYRNDEENITTNYLTLIIPTAGVASLRIDGSNVFNHTYVHPRLPGYTVVIKRWSATKTQSFAQSDSAFTAITYGLGSVESYGYNAGTMINNLSAEGVIYNVADSSLAKTAQKFTCTGTPMRISAMVAYKPVKMVWKLSSLTAVSPNTDVTVTAPVAEDSAQIGSAMYYKYSLPGTYIFNASDTFYLPILNTHPAIENCYQTEEVKIPIVVKQSPSASFEFTHSGCVLDSVYFNGPVNGGNGAVINKWNWSFGDTSTSTVEDPIKLYTAPGTYNINLKVITGEGCLGDTTRSITIGDKPVASIVVTPPNVCEGTSVTFSDTTSNAASGTWYWDFGNGSIVTLNANTPQTVTYASPGTYTVKHMFKSSATCISDTVSKVVTVYAKPATGFTFTAGCLPRNTAVQFTDTTKSFGQNITSWQWDFGDPASGASNTSVLQNPTHVFSSSGTYNIRLTVTTENGCTAEKVIQGTFTYNPILTLTKDTTICVGNSVVLTANGATTFTWSPAAGLSATTGSSVTAKPDVTTTYTVVGTTNGCTSTETVTVTIVAKPAKPVVTTPVSYCQNSTASPLIATALTGNTLTWYNNSALTGGTATAPTPSTGTAGTFYYYVTQSNGTGCISDTSKIEVIIQPTISGNAISGDQTLCSGTAAATIMSSGSTTGGTGTFTYQWQQSMDGGNTWTNIPGATTDSYDPDVINTGVTKFRRVVNSGLCNSNSNVITLTVETDLNNIEISGSQTICEGSRPAILDGQTPTGGTGNYTFVWESSPNGTTWSAITGATSEDYHPPILNSNIYYRRKTSGGNCPAISQPVLITVKEVPNGVLSAKAAICDYESGDVTFTPSRGTPQFTIVMEVTAPGGGITSVTKNITTNSPQTFNIIPVNSPPGVYTIKLISISDVSNCVRTAGLNDVSITVTAKPVLSLTPDVTVCEGVSTTLNVSGATTYSWSPSAGLSATTGAAVIANPASTTTYTVVGTTNGCTSTGTVTVNIISKPSKPTVTNVVNYCIGATASPLSATASTGNTLTWYNDVALTGGTSTAPTPSTATEGKTNYYVTQTNSNGCISEAAIIEVHVRPKPVVDFTLPANVCTPNGSAAFINNSTISDNSSLTYEWNFGDGSPASNVKSPTHIYATSGSYNVTLKVTSAYGCVSVTTKVMSSFFERPTSDFNINANTLCQGQRNTFTDLSTPASDITKWTWSFGDGNTSSSKNPSYTYSKAGNFSVTLVTYNSVGCASLPVSKSVLVHLQPVIDAGPNFTVPDGTIVQFKATANDTSTLKFLWSPALGLSDATILKPSLTVSQNQDYTLTATGNGGCTATDMISVRLLGQVEVPNAFSPNGDGINDVWEIPNLGDYPGARVEIYNRWGQQVFLTYGYSKPWDGSYLGKPLPLATYYYIIILKNGFKPITGSVTIIK